MLAQSHCCWLSSNWILFSLPKLMDNNDFYSKKKKRKRTTLMGILNNLHVPDLMKVENKHCRYFQDLSFFLINVDIDNKSKVVGGRGVPSLFSNINFSISIAIVSTVLLLLLLFLFMFPFVSISISNAGVAVGVPRCSYYSF